MLKQLLQALHTYASYCKEGVKKGRYSGEFASALIQAYAKSMMKALKKIGKDGYILKIQSETDQLCSSVDRGYRPKLKKLIAIGRKTQMSKNKVAHL